LAPFTTGCITFFFTNLQPGRLLRVASLSQGALLWSGPHTRSLLLKGGHASHCGGRICVPRPRLGGQKVLKKPLTGEPPSSKSRSLMTGNMVRPPMFQTDCTTDSMPLENAIELLGMACSSSSNASHGSLNELFPACDVQVRGALPFERQSHRMVHQWCESCISCLRTNHGPLHSSWATTFGVLFFDALWCFFRVPPL
jgi:hypothetical protein